MIIVNQQISLGDEPLKDLLPTPVLQVQRNPTLIGIEIEKQPAFFRVRQFAWKGAASRSSFRSPAAATPLVVESL